MSGYRRLTASSFLAIALIRVPTVPAQTIAPHWEGVMVQQGSALPISLDFTRRDTALTATWSAPSMQAFHWPDAFPESDLGLRKAMGGLSSSRLRAAAEAWRPWRAYAAQHLWASLPDNRG